MNDYRDKEFKYYIIAIILVYIVMIDGIGTFVNGVGNDNTVAFIKDIVDLSIISSSIYAMAIVLNMVYSNELKMKLIYFHEELPAQHVFSDIKNEKIDFLNKKEYEEIITALPEEANERKKYESEKWLKIYNKYRTDERVSETAKDFRMCRDIHIATINILIVYLVLCITTKKVIFSWKYVIFLLIMFIATKIAAHQRGTKWVRNALKCDVLQRSSTELGQQVPKDEGKGDAAVADPGTEGTAGKPEKGRL